MRTARHSKSAGPTASQTQTLLSREQLATRRPSGLHATLLHSLSWPSSGSTGSQWVAVDEEGVPEVVGPSSRPCSSVWHQMPTVESNEAVARVAPVGEKARERTVRVCEVGMVEARWKCEGDEVVGSGEYE